MLGPQPALRLTLGQPCMYISNNLTLTGHNFSSTGELIISIPLLDQIRAMMPQSADYGSVQVSVC